MDVEKRIGFWKDRAQFRYWYLLDLLLCGFCFISPLMEAAKVVLFLWSLPLLIRLIFVEKAYGKLPFHKTIALFMAAGLVSILLHAESYFLFNFVLWYHTGICLILLYGDCACRSWQENKPELVRVMKTVVVVMTAATAAGLLIVLVWVRIYALNHVVGLMDNRYVGLFMNPNHAAFTSVIAIIGAHFLYRQGRGRNGKYPLPLWLLAVCAGLNLVAVLLSDSNASLLLLLGYVAVQFFFKAFPKGITPAKGVVNALGLLLACAVLAGGALGGRELLQKGVGMLVSGRQQVVIGDTINPTVLPDENGERNNKPIAGDVGDVEIGRTATANGGDLTSGRIDSLTKAAQVFLHYPVFGVGYCNIVPYSERLLPEPLLFADIHNGYMTILVSQGAVGLLLFLVFFVGQFALLLRNAFRRRDINALLLLSFLLSYCVFSLLEIALLLYINYPVAIFWGLLGFAASQANTLEVGNRETALNQHDKRCQTTEGKQINV